MKKLSFFAIIAFVAFTFTASASTIVPQINMESVSDTVKLKEYAGKYKFVGLPFEYMEITLKEGVLNVEAGDQGGPMTQDKEVPEKFDVAGEALFKFVRNDEKKVVKVVVEYQGMTLEGTKDK
jgi:hypothetical protein